jgi:uroporphyrinogen-III synthase
MQPSMPSLSGLTILVTRPKELADNLALLIKQAGGTPVLYPVISIEEPDNTQQRDNVLNNLSSYDIGIFISPSAVRKTFEQINKLPATLKLAAIGSGTEKSLAHKNVVVSISSEGHDSESLLEHPELQSDKVSGKSIIIFKGQGGRELLDKTLASRGGNVKNVEVYQRKCAKGAPALSIEQLEKIDIITITSSEGLQNLVDLSENQQALLKLPLLAPGERCLQLAKSLGFSNIVGSQNATDASCLDTLLNWATILDSKPTQLT